MTTIAAFKWAMNPVDERLAADGSVKWLAERPEIGDDDHAAVAVALDAAAGGSVIGLTMDSGDVAFGAARGLENTVAVQGVGVFAQPTELAAALANSIKGIEGADLVVIGDCVWQPMVPGLVAGLLGWPCINAVDAARRDGEKLVVTRRFGPGTQDILVDGPAVLAVAARREEESKPGMRAVLAARKKPVDRVETQIADAPVFVREGTHEPDSRPSKIFDGADLQAAVDQLVAALKNEGVL